MTVERMEEISSFLMGNESQIPELMGMEPAIAAERMKSMGFVVTAEELIEYSAELNKMNPNGELDENSLDSVSGGGLVTTFLVGVCVGYLIYNKVW